MYKKIIDLIQKNLSLLLLSPIILNFFMKLILGEVVLLNYYQQNKIVILILITNSIFFTYLSYQINSSLKLNSLSLSLVYFLSSFFIVDFLLLIVFKNVLFKYIVIIVYLLWAVLLSFLKKNKIVFLKVTMLFAVNNYINQKFYKTLTNVGNYQELNTDVPLQWFKLADLISSNNYYFALSNNVIEGQTLFISYIQALIFNLNFYLYDFEFIRINANIVLVFITMLVCDLKISNRNKIIACLALFSIILNSDWLTYLFIDSLMLEGIVSFIFATFLLNLKQHTNQKFRPMSLIFFIFFSSLLFTKQFVSLLTIFLFVYIFLKYKNVNSMVIPIFYSIDFFYKKYVILESGQFELIKGTSISELVTNLFLFRNLEISNISKIINQLLIDRPVSYLLLLFIILNVFRLTKNSKDEELNLIFTLVIINFVLIFALYVAWWQDFGIQSSFRYILNLFNLFYLSTIIHLDSTEKNI
jgi:hypothetical protein